MVWGIAAAAAWILSLVLFYHVITVSVDKRIAKYQSDLVERHGEEVENMYRSKELSGN